MSETRGINVSLFCLSIKRGDLMKILIAAFMSILAIILSCCSIVFAIYNLNKMHNLNSRNSESVPSIECECGYKHKGALYRVDVNQDKLTITNKLTNKVLHRCNPYTNVNFSAKRFKCDEKNMVLETFD